MAAALVVVDIQNDFCPGGSLAVEKGTDIIPGVNRIRDLALFSEVIFTRDWHPDDHVSFAKNHPEQNEFELIKIDGFDQMLWPVHCTQGSSGAEFHEALDVREGDFIASKGTERHCEQYSAFGNSDRSEYTDFADQLKERGIRDIYICGLATDYCVGSTAVDAAKHGFNVYLLEDLARGIAADTVASMREKMTAVGVKYMLSADLENA